MTELEATQQYGLLPAKAAKHPTASNRDLCWAVYMAPAGHWEASRVHWTPSTLEGIEIHFDKNRHILQLWSHFSYPWIPSQHHCSRIYKTYESSLQDSTNIMSGQRTNSIEKGVCWWSVTLDPPVILHTVPHRSCWPDRAAELPAAG